jgi:hypothetical protein
MGSARSLFSLLLLTLYYATASAALVTINDAGSWNWFQDERVIVTAGKLIVGSVADGIHDRTRAGNVEVVSYDLSTSRITRFVLHHPANDVDRKRWLNDHSAPAFTVRPDGRIVAMYSLHGLGNTLYYRISDAAGSVTSWSVEREFQPASNSKVTFPNLHFLSSENGGEGRVYAFFRGIDQRQLPSWAYSDNLGETWAPGASFIEIPDKPKVIPYVKYCSNGSDTVHIAFTSGHHLDYGNALYHFYYRGGELFRSDGKPIHTLRAGLKTVEAATCIFRANRGSVVWVSDVHMDRAGAPYIAYSVQKDSANLASKARGEDHRYRYARWTGSRWVDYEIAYAGSRIHTYADGDDCTGLVALDPQDPNVVFISTNADPATGRPLISRADHQRHWEVFRGTTRDGGAKWSWTAITRDSSLDNIRPVIPVWQSERRAVIWLRGQMRTYTDYTFDVAGIISERH